MTKTPLYIVQTATSSEFELAIPDDELAAQFDFEANATYHDLRPLDWSDTEIALQRDRSALARHLAGESIEDFSESLSAEGPEPVFEITDDDLFLELFRARDALDMGVGGAVAALAAIGCTPFDSCNGGAFGGSHNSAYPIIRFFAPAHIFPEIAKCASMAGVELEIDPLGRVELTAGKIEPIMTFAERIVERLGPRSSE